MSIRMMFPGQFPPGGRGGPNCTTAGGQSERRESDSSGRGEREFDMLGCDTTDVDAPCAKRRIRELLGCMTLT